MVFEKGSAKKRSAASIYQVQSYYRRFNQKYNMTRQVLWNKAMAKTAGKRGQNMRKLAGSGAPGYTILDLAFLTGARANFESAGFNNNRPNRGGNAWDAAPQNAHAGSYQASAKDRELFKRWEGSPEENARILKKMSLYFGADQVGLCLLDRRWVYSHWFDEDTLQSYPIKFSDEPGYEDIHQPQQLDDGIQVIPKEMKYVVVFLHEMGKEGIAAAPTLHQYAETQYAYSRLSFTAIAVAEFIRGLGYHAIPSANCTALSVPLAVDAGLGQVGRHGKLINPKYGPRCRISKVITDLPIVPDSPIDFGVTEFCHRCKKCAEYCPSGAITFGERSFEAVDECNNSGYLQWPMDHKKCNSYWTKVGTNCGVCLRVCPFSHGQGVIHDIVRWFIKHLRFSDSFFLKMDNIFGYGAFRSPNKRWYK